MPRKAKEKIDENEIIDEKKTSTKKATKAATKKSSVAKKDLIEENPVKKNSSTKKTPTSKATSASKKETSKKEPVKRATASKKSKTEDAEVKSETTPKKSSAKKETTKKAASSKKSKTEDAEVKSETTSNKSSAKKETTKKAASSKKSKSEDSVSKTKTSSKKVATKSTSKASKSAKSSTSKTNSAKKTSTRKKSTKVEIFEAENTTPTQITEYYDLPYKYGNTVVKLLAQTPNTLFVYWEVSDEDISNFKNKYGNDFFSKTKPFLVVHNLTLNKTYEIEINDFANCWYLNTEDSDCKFDIELIRKFINIFTDSDGNEITYLNIATSNTLQSPNDHILFEKIKEFVIFRNVNDNSIIKKNIKSFKFLKDIYKFYKNMYNEDVLNNPSSEFKL